MSLTLRVAEWITSQDGAIFSALFVSSACKYLWLQQARAARNERFALVGHVCELTVYPIKACRGVDLQSAIATPFGLCQDGYVDRRWMIESRETGTFVNMKTNPRLTLVTCKVDGDWLVITAPDMEQLRLPRNPDPKAFQHVLTSIHGTQITTLDCGTEANDWMSRYMRLAVRLLYSGPGVGSRDAYDLPVAWGNEARKGDKAVFAYLTSYLLNTTASLSELNSRLDSPVKSRNFRPNIVVDNEVPFDEDTWEEIRIGQTVKFHYVQPCRRCPITTVNPNTAERSEKNQPLKTLMTYRKRDPYGHSPLFGAYIALDCGGTVNVGDPVYAIKRQLPAF